MWRMLYRFFVITLVAGSVSTMTGCSTNRHISSGEIWHYRDLAVGFSAGDWRFFLGARGEIGDPIEAFLSLYAQNGSKVFKITSPLDMNKLSGLVVESSEAALSYVRLFTEQDTFILFYFPNGIERYPQTTKVRQQDRWFVVDRRLILAEEIGGKGHPLLSLQEQVSFDGKYTLLKKEVLKYIPAEEVNFPVIE